MNLVSYTIHPLRDSVRTFTDMHFIMHVLSKLSKLKETPLIVLHKQARCTMEHCLCLLVMKLLITRR
jgi:hypothetical protein